MALFTPSESPAIVVKEIDLTGGVPNVQSTTGAFVGNFNWGPVEQPTLISSEAGLVETFGAPSDSNAVDFISAAYFLRYSNKLQVVRMVDSDAGNAHGDLSSLNLTAPVVKNRDNFDDKQSGLDSDAYLFVARFPGELGNSIEVQICPGNKNSTTNFDAWSYAGEFDGAPATSPFAADRNATNDEYHVLVLDAGGRITGTEGAVLETFQFLSVGSNAMNRDGTSNYGPEVINRRSQYIYQVGFSSSTFAANAGTLIDSGDNFYDASYSNVQTFRFTDGANSADLGTQQYALGFDQFEDVDAIEVDFLIAPHEPNRTNHKTIVNDLVSIAENTRKDCVVVASPPANDVLGLSASTAVTNTVTAFNGITYSSYLIADNNYLKVYDKYNDKYINIPAASSTAGIMAASDANTAPWYSPAGPRRGRYFGVTNLSYSPSKSQRDVLYRNGINPIANIPGQGVLLYGDKTKLNRVSAFDRINVRRLFLVLERAIARAAVNTLFELNDEFTRAEFVNIVEPTLREVKGRRGITDFRVVCDETNNTPAVVDRNEFIASIFIKPARSINYITLNFVGVRSGVDFEEVVGTV